MSKQYHEVEMCRNPFILQLSCGMEQANTYVLGSNGHAIIIDACSKRIVDELYARNIDPDYVILTHEHADHIWGLNCLRENFPKIKVIAHGECSKSITNSNMNKAAHYKVYATLRFGEAYHNSEAENRKYYCKQADIMFADSYEFQYQEYRLRVVHTPGHSPGSCMIFLGESIVFSGDTMLNEDTFLKFEGGNEDDYFKITLPLLKNIEKKVKIFPGHGKPFLRKDWLIESQ